MRFVIYESNHKINKKARNLKLNFGLSIVKIFVNQGIKYKEFNTNTNI